MKLALLLLLATGAVVSAQSLTVQTRTTTAPEMGTIRYLQLHCDGQTYTMSPPSADWRSKLDGAKARLQFFAPLGTAVATLRFTTGAASNVLASSDALRQHAAPDLEDARKLAEFDVFSGDAAGKAAEYAYTLRGQPMRCRVAAVPVPGGTVDFTLHSPADEFDRVQPAFGAMLNTFRRTSRTSAETTAARGGPTISGH